MDNYEEKYKAALGWMQSLYGGLHGATKEEAEKYFPELKESEDERIRKKVIEVLKLNIKGAESQMQASRGVDRCFEIYACNKVIAWLERRAMTRHNNDIAACGHATCPSRHTCLRWQLGQQMSDYQWWANFKPTNGGCKYFMYHNPNDNDNEKD